MQGFLKLSNYERSDRARERHLLSRILFCVWRLLVSWLVHSSRFVNGLRVALRSSQQVISRILYL